MPHLFSRRKGAVAVFAAVCIAFPITVYAQNSSGPQPVPLPPPVVAPADTPYPATISLLVDITNIAGRVLNVQETIPVKGRDLTLLYPEWLPGTHSPSNPVSELAGLMVTANGKRVPWVRDRVNMHAFHIDVPRDATTLEINFQFLALWIPNGVEFPRSSPTLRGTACCSIRRDIFRGISNSELRCVCPRDGNSPARWM